MNIDYDKFIEKIPKTPATIEFIFVGDANIAEELGKIFGEEKIFTEDQIEKIKSYSLALRDFIMNIRTILLFAKLNDISLNRAIKKQFDEEKETFERVILKFLLKKNLSELTPDEIKNSIEFGLAIKDIKGELHLHPMVAELKKS